MTENITEDLRYIVALTNIRGIGAIKARLLIDTFGSARRVLEADAQSLQALPRVGSLILEYRGEALLERADREIRFMDDHHIRPLVYGQEGYPHRLMQCQDAPALLYYLGSGNLECPHILSIVGTRACTQYGRDLVDRLLADLKTLVPNLIVVSGLAFGIDIAAHQAALTHGIPTVGVVAHGLDRIYPTAHRNTASQMIDQGGGVITEYPTGTEPIAGNFLARNRIIAGLADAVLVAESREKGGSLVTASIATDYNRDVFAFPGRVNDDRSKGCNRLIRMNRAGLITCAQDLAESLGWCSTSPKKRAVQQTIPFDDGDNLSERGRLIVNALRQQGDLRLTQLADATNLDTAILLEELLDLELEGTIRACPGGSYRLR